MKCLTERPLKDGLKTTVCDCFIRQELLTKSNHLRNLQHKIGHRDITDDDLVQELIKVMLSLQYMTNRLDHQGHITIDITKFSGERVNSILEEPPF